MGKKILQFFEKHVYIFSALFAFLLFAIIFKCNNLYPFGSLSISWCDMDQQTIPLLCDFKDVLSGKDGFFLSLKNAGGMNFYGVYFFNLSSPFTYLVLFFDKSQIPLAVNLMVILKLTCAALTFALWLRYSIKNCSPFLVIPISISYAFSGYAMMYYQILSWLDTLYLFPLLLIGLQKITEGKSNLIYIITLFACVLCHFYLSWAVIIFVCLYAGVYCILNLDRARAFAKSFILGSVIAALLSCIVLIPCFMQYTHSMRGGDIISGLKYENFTPHIETSFPTFFGMFLTLPFALYFGKKSKISVEGIMLLLMAVPVFIEPVSMAWQTYDYMSFPTRYGFITIAMGLGLATKKLCEIISDSQEDEGKKFFNKQSTMSIIRVVSSVVLITAVIIFARGSYEYFLANKEGLTIYSRTLWGNADSLKKLASYYAIFLVTGIILLVLTKLKSIHKVGVYTVIGGLCVIEAVFSCGVYMVAPSNDYSEFKRAHQINELVQDDEFYRLKTESKYFHVNLIGAMGYNSMSHYTSLNRESYMLMAKRLGYSSYWMEVNSNGGTIFTDALMRNKYNIYSGYVKPEQILHQTENYKIIENNLILPFGFLIESGGSANIDLTLPRWQIQNNICQRLLGVSLYEQYPHTQLNGVTEFQNDGKNYNFQLEEEGGYLTYEFDVDGEKTIYFDIFDRYSNSLRESTYDSIEKIIVYKNGYLSKTLASYPTQSKNGCLSLGSYKDAKLLVRVYLSKSVSANTFGIFSVDNEMLESAVNQSIGGHFDIKKSEISGKITASKGGQYAFFCLPYDEGYRAKVNGKRVEVANVNDFVAVALEAGENEVELSFIPEGFGFGLIMFLVGIVALVAYMLFGQKLNDIKWLSRLCFIGVIGLLVVVIIAVYIFPPLINLTKYF